MLRQAAHEPGVARQHAGLADHVEDDAPRFFLDSALFLCFASTASVPGSAFSDGLWSRKLPPGKQIAP